MSGLRALVVDDEPLVRRGLTQILTELPDVHVVGEAADGREALDRIETLTPDIVFLDIQMPELSGIEVARALDDPIPAVVFVTAFDHYAVAAFDVHAVDYLLKPFDEERVRRAVDRARARRAAAPDAGLADRLRDVLAKVAPVERVERFVVRTGRRAVLVAAHDVDWIEAADNYVRLHVGAQHHVVRVTIQQLATELDPALFARIHRCTIVNLTRVRELLARTSGDWDVVLKDGSRLTLSRRYRQVLEQRMRMG